MWQWKTHVPGGSLRKSISISAFAGWTIMTGPGPPRIGIRGRRATVLDCSF